ncbi:MAG: SLBB domain-containing protein [Deltaproteobacteria bacterium]|nr:SLBB domain-containing protein [Deltaproteobacteria bacterium]
MTEPTREQILDRIRAAGVVGAGGGGFPAHVKLDARVEVVLANGAECEPLVRVDQQEMADRPAELLRGLLLAMAATGARRGIVGLKAKYKTAVERLGETIRQRRLADRVSLHLLENFYPAGDEFVLVREALGRAIPEFGLPLDVGAVVSNVSTLLDVAAAVDEARPVTHRLVTVTGAVREPSSFRVPLGTPLGALVAAAGGPTEPRTRLIAGGPMMGTLVPDDGQPVVKTTSAVLVLPEQHPVVQRRLRDAKRQLQLTRTACLKCMMCTEICPRNLLGHRLYPDRLMRNLAAGVTEDLEAFVGSFLCSECGLCAVYGCVMNLDPAYVNRTLKAKLAAAGVPRPAPPTKPERVFQPLRRVPLPRLVARLGLTPYDRPAPLRPFERRVPCLVVPLKQHAGLPARAVVRTGQRVAPGDLLGELPEGKLGARVHAGTAGRVVEVTDAAVTIEVE